MRGGWQIGDGKVWGADSLHPNALERCPRQVRDPRLVGTGDSRDVAGRPDVAAAAHPSFQVMRGVGSASKWNENDTLRDR